MDDFETRGRDMAARMTEDPDLLRITREWFRLATRYEYSYHFTWLGRPIIQFPQDILALQEIIWSVKPDLVIETGIARGGSLVFYASLLELLGGDRRVVGIDVDLREHNRAALQAHPLFERMTLLDGSSTDPRIVDSVRAIAAARRQVLVVLDSLHTHQHVLAELEAYAPLVKPPSYVVVLDTIIEDLPPEFSANRPWGPGNSPKTAVREFMSRNDRFVVDHDIEAKLLISVGPGGYLRCVRP